MYMLKQNRGAHIEPETGKDTLTQVVCPAQGEDTLFLGKKCYGPKALPYVAEWRSKDCM